MKNIVKQLGIVFLILIIGFLMTACPGVDDNNGNNENTGSTTGTPGLEFTPIKGNTEYSVKLGTAVANQIVIPAKYNGLPVTAIGGGYAFSGCTGLTSITIPNSVTSIGWDAFNGWTASQTIHIPFATLDEADWEWSSSWRGGNEYLCNAVIKNNAGVQVWPL